VSIGPGAILGGKYRLAEPIGKGGMGEVFEATAIATGERVAIKVVNRTYAARVLMERLRREAQAARRVQSEFVPRLYDVDSTPEGELFLVMELLHGETLASRLRRYDGVMPWDEVARLGEDVLRGLVDAHAAGVIHRDLKPGNIFLEATPVEGHVRARVLDFGVCKLDAHDGEALTTTGEAVGTIAYMAPEQIRGASRVDERADVYAFAMVVFEALSGRLAYEASGSIALIACKLEKPARSLRDFARVAVPPELDRLLARCLARRTSERPRSAEELLREWRALGPATMQPAPLPGGEIGADGPTETGVTASPTRMTRTTRRGARLGLLAAGCTLVASCAVLFLGLRPRAEPGVAAAASSSEPPAPPSVASAPAPSPPAPPPIDPPSVATPPVVVSSAAAPAAGTSRPAPGARARPPGRGKRVPPPSAPARPAEPQIVAEPRY
jgi:serine/threonine-protein kinase